MTGMSRVAVAAGVCGLAASAEAQTLAIDISFDKTWLGIGETAVVTVTATLNGLGSSAYFALIAADFRMLCGDTSNLSAAGYASASTATGLDWANPALGEVSGGTPAGGDLLGVFGAQSTFLPPADDSSPFVIAQWVITGTAEGAGRYTMEATGNAPAPVAYVDPTTNPFAAPQYLQVGDVGLEFTSDVIRTLTDGEPCVPASGTTGLAVIGLGLMGRRRRAGGLR